MSGKIISTLVTNRVRIEKGIIPTRERIDNIRKIGLSYDVIQEIIKYSDNKSRNELKITCFDFYNAHENLRYDCIQHFLTFVQKIFKANSIENQFASIKSHKNLIDTFCDFDKDKFHSFPSDGYYEFIYAMHLDVPKDLLYLPFSPYLLFRSYNKRYVFIDIKRDGVSVDINLCGNIAYYECEEILKNNSQILRCL